jgi:hypothetical protein
MRATAHAHSWSLPTPPQHHPTCPPPRSTPKPAAKREAFLQAEALTRRVMKPMAYELLRLRGLDKPGTDPEAVKQVGGGGRPQTRRPGPRASSKRPPARCRPQPTSGAARQRALGSSCPWRALAHCLPPHPPPNPPGAALRHNPRGDRRDAGGLLGGVQPGDGARGGGA